MWARIRDNAERTIRDTMTDCRFTLDPDGAAISCTGIYHAPHAEAVQTGDGAVGVCTTDPAVDVYLPDLPVTPKTRDICEIAQIQADGTYAEAERFRITDTQDNGHGSVTLRLVRAG